MIRPKCADSTNVCKLWNMCESVPQVQELFAHDGPGSILPVGGRLFGADADMILSRLYVEFANKFKLLERQKVAIESRRIRMSSQKVEFLESPVRIFIFGFSRGAYIARMLSHIIATCGVPRDGKVAKKVIKQWRKGDASKSTLDTFRREKILSDPICVEYVGLWDCVRAGIKKVRSTDYHFLDDRVVACRHAIAANEYRCKFSVARIHSECAKEMVFPGSHCDVGGGYRHYNAIADVTLAWIANEGIRRGLLTQEKCLLSEELVVQNAMIHDSTKERIAGLPLYGFSRIKRRHLYGTPRHECMKYKHIIQRERVLLRNLKEENR